MHFDLFTSPDALTMLAEATPEAIDALEVGVIGFDAHGIAAVYNRRESAFSGLLPGEVIGRPIFTEIAQCMNNYFVAQRFEDAAFTGQPLDATLDYVLTWRMRPTAVQLRLLWAPPLALRWILLRHAPAGLGGGPGSPLPGARFCSRP